MSRTNFRVPRTKCPLSRTASGISGTLAEASGSRNEKEELKCH